MILPFNFIATTVSVKGKEVEVVGLPNSKSVEIVEDWIEATGLSSPEAGLIPWQSNPLPAMAKRVYKFDKNFQIVKKDGWIKTIIPMPTFKSELEDLDDSEFEGEEFNDALEPAVDFEEPPDTLEVDDDEELPWE